MTQEVRKATDVVLNLENLVLTLLDLVRSQDFNIKIISNKLNDLSIKLERLEGKTNSPSNRVSVEAIQTKPSLPPMPVGDPEKNIIIRAEDAIPQEISPQGFRRTSRPETFVADDVNSSQQNNNNAPKMLMPNPITYIPTPSNLQPLKKDSSSEQLFNPNANKSLENNSLNNNNNIIPVNQRCVDKNNKAILFADVEILDLPAKNTVFKTRTNSAGKWNAPLAVGEYRVFIRKKELNGKIEASQDIKVNNSQKILELPPIQIK